MISLLTSTELELSDLVAMLVLTGYDFLTHFDTTAVVPVTLPKVLTGYDFLTHFDTAVET